MKVDYITDIGGVRALSDWPMAIMPVKIHAEQEQLGTTQE